MPHRQSSGRTQPCSVRVTSLPSCPAARPVLCIPGDRGMLRTHSRAKMPGPEGELPAGGGGGLGRKGAPSADNCCSLQPPAKQRVPIPPGSSGSLRDAVPHSPVWVP